MAKPGGHGRQFYIDCITNQLGSLALKAKLSSAGNRNDTAVVSEHTLCGLLNLLKGWNLTNANTPGHPNFPGVDLVDENAQVAVQVTVDNTVKKVDDMLEKFKAHKLNRKFKHLILLVLTLDKPTNAMLEREDGCFYGRDNIWNFQRLMGEIEQVKDVDLLRRMAEYLDKELGSQYTAPVPEVQVKETGEKETKILVSDNSGDKSYETKIIEKETDGTKTIGTTILITDNGGREDAGNETTGNEDTGNEDTGDDDTGNEGTESGETLKQRMARWMAERKQKRQDKKARKREKAKKKSPGKKKKRTIWLLPLILIAALCFLWPDKPLEEMPEELADYSVTINGQKISLPTTLDKLEEMGWVLKDAEEYMQIQMPPHSYYVYYGENEFWGGTATLTNGHGTMDISLGNASNHTVPFEECVVYGLVCSYSFDDSYTGEAVNTLEGPLGLIWGQSSYRDVKWPAGYEKRKSSVSVTYTYQLNANQRYKLQFNKTSRKLTYLSITNRDEEAMAALVGAAYDTQAPGYDAGALAEKLGVNMTFRVGDLTQSYDFQVGATVQEYADLGYTIDKQPEFVVSNDTGEVCFRCDTLNQLKTAVYNPFHRAMTPENCFIATLDSREMDTDGNISLLISSGEEGVTLSLGARGDVLRGVLREKNFVYEAAGNGETIIYPNRTNRDIKITFWESQETGEITRIRVNISQALQAFMEEQSYQAALEEKFEGIG